MIAAAASGGKTQRQPQAHGSAEKSATRVIA
jgi:hypothetical protein